MMEPPLFQAGGSLRERIEALWRQQSAGWPMLAGGLAALRQARTRTLTVGGSAVLAQCNPARMVSTGAKIDPAAIAARPCFLCTANRPREQLAVPYGEKWLVLCNPAPIFDPHFVIALAAHEPQRIAPTIGPMLDLARELEGDYTVFYNGPRAGASAPDHLHVQAARARVMPFERELLDAIETGADWIEWLRPAPAHLGLTKPGRRPTVVLMDDQPGRIIAALAETLAHVAAVCPAEPEPMLNLFSVYRRGRWVVYLFPRAAHRPSFYGTGEGQWLISPGAVDLAGILITPRPSDFERLDEAIVQALFDQVLPGPGPFARLRTLLHR